MQEKIMYSSRSSQNPGYSEVDFTADVDSQIIVTLLRGVSDNDELKTWSSIDRMLSSPPILVTEDADTGDDVITVDKLTSGMPISNTNIAPDMKIYFMNDKSIFYGQSADVQSVAVNPAGGYDITLKATIDIPIPAGSRVLRMTENTQIPMESNGGAYTVDLDGECVVAGLFRSPLIIGLYGTNPKLFASAYWIDIQ